MSISVADLRDYGCKKLLNYLIPYSTFNELNKVNLVFVKDKASPFVLSSKCEPNFTPVGLDEYRKWFKYEDDDIQVRKNFSKAYLSLIKKFSKVTGVSGEEEELFLSLCTLCPILAIKMNKGEDILKNVSDLSVGVLSASSKQAILSFVTFLDCALLWYILVEKSIMCTDNLVEQLICSDNKDFVSFILNSSEKILYPVL
jgi:hypothetical protein